MKFINFLRREKKKAAVIAFYLFAAIFLIYLFLKNPLKNNVYGIFIHNEKYFHCPSCGATRALYCFLKADFKSAFYYHAFFTVLSPVILYMLVCFTVNLWAGRKIIPYPKHYAVYLYILLGLWMAFTLIRNLTTVIY